MRHVTVLLLIILAATLTAAESSQDAALEAAVRFVPAVLNGTHAKETEGLSLRDFAITEGVVACEDVFLAEWLDQWHSQPVVEELVAAYRANGNARSRITGDSTNVPILALDEFEIGENEYDWERLKTSHPDVQGLVRMSLPALDSHAVYAIVHYEVMTPKGWAFANFQKFEKQGDGTWKPTVGVTGSLQTRTARTAAAAARERSSR